MNRLKLRKKVLRDTLLSSGSRRARLVGGAVLKGLKCIIQTSPLFVKVLKGLINCSYMKYIIYNYTCTTRVYV